MSSKGSSLFVLLFLQEPEVAVSTPALIFALVPVRGLTPLLSNSAVEDALNLKGYIEKTRMAFVVVVTPQVNQPH
jgi:hypothetical protein